MLRRMQALKAVVKNGRLVLDAPTDLPEGEEVELAIVQEEDDPELLAELEASAEDERAGRLVDLKDVIARLGTR
jgi:predicted DNA-binding antitoxin AbrB/MazE fold protein